MGVTMLHYKVGSPQSNKETDTHINISLLPTGSTVVVKCKDKGPLMQGKIIGHGSENYNRICYKIRVTKTGCTITRTK